MFSECFSFLFSSKKQKKHIPYYCRCKKRNLKHDLPEFYPPFPHSFN